MPAPPCPWRVWRRKVAEISIREAISQKCSCGRGDDALPDCRGPEKQLIQGNWDLAYSYAGSVEDGVGNGRRNADDTDFAQPFGAERVEPVIFLDENYVDVVHVGVDRHMIIRQI